MRRRRLLPAAVALSLAGAAGYFSWDYFAAPEYIPETNLSLDGFDFDSVSLPLHTPPVIQAVSAPYEVAADLSNVENTAQFRFTPEQIERIRRDKFLIYDAPVGNPVLVYLETPVPFVTSDILLHVFHTLTEDSLHKEEQIFLRPCLELFLAQLVSANSNLYGRSEGELQNAVRNNLVRFSVALRFLRDDFVPPRSVRGEVNTILNATQSGSKFRFSGRDIDGSLFQTRGDYTHVSDWPESRMDEQQKQRATTWMKKRDKPFDDYFRAVVWLQQCGWNIEDANDLFGLAAFAQTLRDSERARDAYRAFSHVIDIFAEKPDGMSPLDVLEAAQSTFGDDFTSITLKTPELDAFGKALLGKYELKILGRLEGVQVGVERAPKLLFAIPGRYNLSGDLFQRILEDSEMPSGDDYANIVLGAGIPARTKLQRAAALADEVQKRSAENWSASLDGGLQYSLKAIAAPTPSDFPSFMRTTGWRTKSVNSALAGFAQMKHLLFLYDKLAMYYADGGGSVDTFDGYVEPNPEFFNRLAYCVETFRTRLERIGHFTRAQEYYRKHSDEETYRRIFSGSEPNPDFETTLYSTKWHYTTFERILHTLQAMAEKELRNVPFAEEEIRLLKKFGVDMQKLTFNIGDEPDRREKSLICDVAIDSLPPARCLQVATGRPFVLLAVVPRMGKLYLSKGSVASYYEFVQLISERLNDEDWRARKKDPADSWLGRQGLISAPVEEQH